MNPYAYRTWDGRVVDLSTMADENPGRAEQIAVLAAQRGREEDLVRVLASFRSAGYGQDEILQVVRAKMGGWP
jgi:hypothetical protein